MRVYVGHDYRWPIATEVCAASIHAHTPGAEVVLLANDKLPKNPNTARTQFSFFRYLIPELQKFKGIAVYMEQDELCLDDLNKMLAECPPESEDWEVACVQHGYASSVGRPNWASVMVLNCRNLRQWNMENYASKPREWFHELQGVSKFFALNPRWNVLDHWQEDMGILHLTSGGPWDFDKLKGERARCPKACALWESWRDRVDKARAEKA